PSRCFLSPFTTLFRSPNAGSYPVQLPRARGTPVGGPAHHHAGPSVRTNAAASAASTGPVPYDGHHLATGQAPQAGFLAWQMRRPCQITWWLSIVQSRLGKRSATANSTFTGSVSSVQPKRRTRRPKWVSTVMPGRSTALPSPTVAVVRRARGAVAGASRRGV